MPIIYVKLVAEGGAVGRLIFVRETSLGKTDRQAGSARRPEKNDVFSANNPKMRIEANFRMII